ncbi:hypothetical protein B5X24_HaOG206344 [Helicoverpa armigera]|nr:hypothetical protein B5X24_HaOG206344 [Helicoverpa armigera]
MYFISLNSLFQLPDMKTLFLCVALLCALSTWAAPTSEECLCKYRTGPVCGVNGVTYKTECEMRCSKVSTRLAYHGECRERPPLIIGVGK